MRTLWVVVIAARVGLADIAVVVDGSAVLGHRRVEVKHLTRRGRPVQSINNEHPKQQQLCRAVISNASDHNFSAKSSCVCGRRCAGKRTGILCAPTTERAILFISSTTMFPCCRSGMKGVVVT